jgi:hypothetical protein
VVCTPARAVSSATFVGVPPKWGRNCVGVGQRADVALGDHVNQRLAEARCAGRGSRVDAHVCERIAARGRHTRGRGAQEDGASQPSLATVLSKLLTMS